MSTAEFEDATDQDVRQAYSMLMFGNGRTTALAVGVLRQQSVGHRTRRKVFEISARRLT